MLFFVFKYTQSYVPGVITTEVVDFTDPRAHSEKYLHSIDNTFKDLAACNYFEQTYNATLKKSLIAFPDQFVPGLKNDMIKSDQYEERLVVQGHINPENPLIVHESYTLCHCSLQIVFCYASVP